MNRIGTRIGFGLALLLGPLSAPHAQLSTAITYQGRLDEAGQPKVGTVDLRFDAFAAGTGGSSLNSTPVILDAVPLQAGTFTVQVDFGASVFTGTPVFVEVGVREDALGDGTLTTGFTSLSPRQQATATPYSLHAERVAQNAVGGSQIANSSVTGADVQDGSLTASDVNTTSNTTGLQRRLNASCTAVQAVSDVSATGTPACIAPVLSVSTPDGSGINSSSAGGVVTLALDGNEGQDRVLGRCQRGLAAISVINADGSVECVYLAAASATPPVVLDSAGDVGSHLSAVRLGGGSSSTGPGVAYYDNTNNRLKFLKCSSVNCNPLPTPVIIDDPANDVGQFVSAIVINGRTSMAYYDVTAGALKLALCDNFSCSGVITIRTIDNTGDVGRFAEIMEVAGTVGIAYHDSSSNGYKFARCNDLLCTAPTITPLTGLIGAGSAFSDIAASRLAGTFDPLPRFALISQGSAVLMVSCTDVACGAFTTTTVSDNTDVGPPLAMITMPAVGGDRHWVAYAMPAAGTAAIQRCPDEACASSLAVNGSGLTSGAVGVPTHAALLARQQGVPLFLRSDASDTQLGANDFIREDFALQINRLTGAVATGGAIDLTNTGTTSGPGIFYNDTVVDDLVYVRCVRDDCSDF